MIRDDIFFNITLRDSKCDSTFGQKTFLDAYTEKSHVLFGPACDLSLGKYTYEIDGKYIIFIVFAIRVCIILFCIGEKENANNVYWFYLAVE